MSRITLDPATFAQFQVATGPTEVCDPTGKVVGVFAPNAETQSAESLISDEERDRRDKQSARPLSEIWKSLGRT